MNRADVAGIIPVEYSKEIFNAATEQSAAMSLGRRLRDMTTKENVLTIQDTLPYAGFVNEGGLKPVSDIVWKDKKIVAEEVAVIVTVPDNVIADARDNGRNLWEEIKPQLSTAIGKVVDGAIFFSTNKPSTWRDGIVPSAVAAGNVVTQTGDGYVDIMGEGGLLSKVEEDGYFVSGHVAPMATRSYLRGIRTEDGTPLFTSMPDPIVKKTTYFIDGESVLFPKNGTMEGAGKPKLIAGDFNELVYSIREDVKFEIFNTGVISDADGKILLNLMQQDTSAIRVTFRMGWELPNPVNHINSDGATRFPFAVLQNA